MSYPSATTKLLTHPLLGPLLGSHSPSTSTTQYRNLRYAHIPARFADPVLHASQWAPGAEDGVYDATKFGPSCPQHPSGFTYDLSLVGDAPELEREMERRREEEGAGEVDELECVNAVVVVPDPGDSEAVEGKGEGLPVVVWVHGGGFSVGSNSWPQYDLSNFVHTSLSLGKPIIGVSINYRLGPFGFLASTDLNLAGNYALKDQICAFRWIKANISGFGGDAENVTAMGESAGSICLSTLLHTTPSQSSPPFENLILMSGDPTLRRPRDMRWQDEFYASLIPKLSLSHLSRSERKSHLMGMSAEAIVSQIPPFNHWSPTISPPFLPSGITIGQLQAPHHPSGKPRWLKRVLVGDCLHDATCLHGRLLSLPTPQLLCHLLDSLANTFHGSQNAISSPLTSFSPISQILEAYNLPLTSSPRGVNSKGLYEGVLDLMSDLRFHLPSLALAHGLGSRARSYAFHQRNPIPGAPFHSYASHELDLAYLLQNHPSLDASPLGREMAAVFTAFAGGDGVEGGAMVVFGPDDDIRVTSEAEDDVQSRRDRMRMWEGVGWERWFGLGELLQGCP